MPIPSKSRESPCASARASLSNPPAWRPGAPRPRPPCTISAEWVHLGAGVGAAVGVSVLRGQGVGLPTVKVSFWPGVRIIVLLGSDLRPEANALLRNLPKPKYRIHRAKRIYHMNAIKLITLFLPSPIYKTVGTITGSSSRYQKAPHSSKAHNQVCCWSGGFIFYFYSAFPRIFPSPHPNKSPTEEIAIMTRKSKMPGKAATPASICCRRDWVSSRESK